jgi:trimeric autotransporter adhesin
VPLCWGWRLPAWQPHRPSRAGCVAPHETTAANPSIEALEDVAVQVHTYDAEMGRTGGGTFNVAAKSGTNQWRGSGFYQNRPRWGSSNNFFAQRAGTPKPETYYHLAGRGVGGPIVRNRTFFWYAQEGYGSNTTRNGTLRSRRRASATATSRRPSTHSELVVIFDPLTGDANGNHRHSFPGNVIPGNRLNPVARAMTSYLPFPDDDVSTGRPNFFRTAEIHDRAHKPVRRLSRGSVWLLAERDLGECIPLSAATTETTEGGAYWPRSIDAASTRVARRTGA